MKQLVKVYISGPYSTGDQVLNVRMAMDVWALLFEEGYTPFCPHWAMAQHLARPRSYDHWIEYDLEMLRGHDVLHRMPGESKGADIEVKEAERLGIPVVHDLRELRARFPAQPRLANSRV